MRRTAKDNIDIVLNFGNNDLILVECKTVKESGYNKFGSVSRQLKAYVDLAKHNDFRVVLPPRRPWSLWAAWHNSSTLYLKIISPEFN